MQHIFYGVCLFYLVFFTFLYKLLLPLQNTFKTIGLGVQVLGVLGLLAGIHFLLKKGRTFFTLLKNKIISDMLLVYALIWLLTTLVLVNDLPRDLFTLAP